MKSTTAIILMLISVGLYYTFISPQYAKVTALRGQVNQYNDILNNVTELKDRRDTLLSKYNSIAPVEINRLDKALPDHIDTVNIARDFDTIASRYGISIKSLSTAETKTDNVGTVAPVNATVAPGASVPSVQQVSITFSFVATYQNFRSFLRDLESSLRILDITHLSFDTADNGLNLYTLTLTTYWLK